MRVVSRNEFLRTLIIYERDFAKSINNTNLPKIIYTYSSFPFLLIVVPHLYMCVFIVFHMTLLPENQKPRTCKLQLSESLKQNDVSQKNCWWHVFFCGSHQMTNVSLDWWPFTSLTHSFRVWLDAYNFV